MTSNKIKVGILISLIPMASLAQDSGSSEAAYYELHNQSIASSAYQSFKDGNGVDPFKFLDTGYRGRYSNDLSNNVVEAKKKMVNSFLESDESDIFSKTKYRVERERGALSSMYESHLDDEGNFDAEAYAEAYQLHMDSKRLSREEDIGTRFDAVMETMNQGIDLHQGYRESLNNDISVAQNNLVSILSSDAQEKKTALDEVMLNASSRQSSKGDLLNDTLALANQYADCESACEFPPPIDNEEVCQSDGMNYVEQTQAEFIKFGELMRTSRLTRFVHDGREIYSYELLSTYRGGEFSEPYIVESGSKDGFSRGSLTEVRGAGASSNVSRLIKTYEICSD